MLKTSRSFPHWFSFCVLCAVCMIPIDALELYLQVCEKTLLCVLFVISVGGDSRNKVITNSSPFYLSFSILCKFHFSSSHTATFLGIFLFDNLLSEMDLIVSQSMLCQLDFPVFLLSSESGCRSDSDLCGSILVSSIECIFKIFKMYLCKWKNKLGLFTELCHLGPFLVLFKRNSKKMKVLSKSEINKT